MIDVVALGELLIDFAAKSTDASVAIPPWLPTPAAPPAIFWQL